MRNTTPFRPVRLPVIAGLVLILTAVGVAPANAQSDEGVAWSHIYDGHTVYAAAHVVSNSMLAAVQAAIRGESLSDIGEAALGGALGGFVTHLGMRTIGALPEAPIVGLTGVSVGASITRNAAHSRALFEDISVVLPPVILRIRKEGDAWALRPRLAAFGAYSALCTAFGAKGTTFKLGRSLLSGHPVFESEQNYAADVPVSCRGPYPDGGVAVAWNGTIMAPPEGSFVTLPAKVTHESIHVGQYVRDLVVVQEPLSDWALGGPARTDGGLLPAVGQYVVFDYAQPASHVDRALAALSGARGHDVWVNAFSEREAQAMAGQPVCGRGSFTCRW